MNQAPISPVALPDRSGIAVHAEAGAAAVFGAVVVATFVAMQNLVRWITDSYGWVPFFLVTKPLVDLTWRWEFLEIVNQRVNPQAILAVFVALLNGVVIVFSRRKPRYSGRVLLFLGFAMLSVALTPSSWGINELVRLLSGVSFFFSAGLILSDKKKFDRFSIAFLAVLCLPLFLSLLQVAGILPFEYWDWLDGHDVGRASGTYQHPTEIVNFLVYAVPLSLYLWENSGKGRIERVFLSLFFVLAFLGLIFTYHRAGWIVISLELVIWFASKKQVKKILFAVLAVTLLAAVFSDWFSLLSQPATEILRGQVDFASGDFLRGRSANWIVFLSSYANGGPLRWVIGKGGSVPDATVVVGFDFAENEPHNDFLRVLHAYGLIGLFLYLSILAAFFRTAIRLQTSTHPFRIAVGRIFFCSLAGIFLLSLTTEPMRYPTGIWYLFALGSVAMFLEADLKVISGNGGKSRKKAAA
jgi:O-antigen ligase